MYCVGNVASEVVGVEAHVGALGEERKKLFCSFRLRIILELKPKISFMLQR